MASITPYEGNRFRVVIRRTGHVTKSKIFPSKRLAEAWARSVETDIDYGRYRIFGENGKITVREIMERFSFEECPKRKGQRWEQVRIVRLLRTADFVDKQISKIRPEDIRDWRDKRLKEVSPATVNRELNLISGIITHAIKEWSVPLKDNPVHSVKRPPATKSRTRRWSQDEIDAILKLSGWDINVKPKKGRDFVGWAVLLAIETAMRLGELCSMRVKDFHPTERYVLLHDTKNGDERAVPLSTKAVELLTAMTKDEKETKKIFKTTAGSLGCYFREVRKEAGFVDLHFHDTRHEAATRLSRKLANVLELSAVTGHRSLQSLKRYYNPTATELAAKLD